MCASVSEVGRHDRTGMRDVVPFSNLTKQRQSPTRSTIPSASRCCPSTIRTLSPVRICTGSPVAIVSVSCTTREWRIGVRCRTCSHVSANAERIRFAPPRNFRVCCAVITINRIPHDSNFIDTVLSIDLLNCSSTFVGPAFSYLLNVVARVKWRPISLHCSTGKCPVARALQYTSWCGVRAYIHIRDPRVHETWGHRHRTTWLVGCYVLSVPQITRHF
jgi:hypothetical protein